MDNGNKQINLSIVSESSEMKQKTSNAYKLEQDVVNVSIK